jgi:tetratricopeptide (TPR) repeat protein
MAIDKSRTSPFMKAVIIFVAATFVVGIGFSSMATTCSSATPTGSPTTAPSTSTTQTIDAIGLQFTPIIKAAETSLTADPKNYDLLVAQAQNYYGWGQQVQEALKGAGSGQDTPIWKAASTYYARALAIKSGDVATMGDYAVTLFYSGDTAAAIVEGEKVKAADPKFAPNIFNLGIFYASSGDNAKAKAAFEAYLVLAPQGDMAQAAKDNIAALATP